MNSTEYKLRLNSIRGANTVGILSDEEYTAEKEHLQEEYIAVDKKQHE